MAKPRKQKAGEQQSKPAEGSSGGAGTIRHQKLCLSIDMKRRMIYGHTEMELLFPESGFIGLHAVNMTIGSVLVNGDPAEFEHFQHCWLVEDEKRWCSVSCSATAADAACSTYMTSVDKEMTPNLFISCCKIVDTPNDRGHVANGGDHSQNTGEKTIPIGHNDPALNQNVKLVRINYQVDVAESGIHFGSNLLYTDNQIRRARCWFPCMDSSTQCCCYDMEFTVDSNLVAVSNGDLLYQILNRDDPSRKTYVYKLNVPISACWISLAVAPFEVLPDSHNGLLSHLSLTQDFSKLRNTVGFFNSAFSHYEDYLSASFPFRSYKQVFIPPEFSVSPVSLGASMCIFPSNLLFDEKVIDETIQARIKLASALARQWFGVYVVGETPNDEWLVDGLAGFLTDSFIKRFLGNNEARYRRFQANCAVCKADVSGATALSSSAAAKDLHGTQSLGLLGKIRSWKAVAILQMLEKQMGPESFRKILQIIIYRARGAVHPLRTLSTKEFRHLANKVGNLERPFLKDFFPRWVGSCGCPTLWMGCSYNKRRNMVELAVVRDSTAQTGVKSAENPNSENRDSVVGWPGMMSIRVHELDGMYDHPILSMSGETWQLLEIQCHSKFAAKRIQKPKKGTKTDGSDENTDAVPTLDARTCMDSPLLWLRADPEMEYLAEIHFHQPVQMWMSTSAPVDVGSSNSSNPDPNDKRPKDIGWKYGVPANPQNRDSVKCTFCQKVYNGGIYRLKCHLAGSSPNVAGCQKVPVEVRNEIREVLQKNKQAKQSRMQSIIEAEGRNELFKDSMSTTSSIEVNQHGSNPLDELLPKAPTMKGPMDKFALPDPEQSKGKNVRDKKWEKEHREKVIQYMARWMYQAGIPFNTVRLNSFQTMVEAIGQYGPGLKGPSYHEIRETCLSKEVKRTQELVDAQKENWFKYGCSIMSDAWTDTKGRTLINFLVNSPGGSVFLKSVDASLQVKDAKLLADLLDKVVKEVGAQHVIQIVTDNGSNYVAAGRMLMAVHPHLFWTPCAAHCIDLMLEDICKLSPMKLTIQRGKMVTTFIYAHTRILAMMRQFTNDKNLARAAVTRFATNYLNLQSLLDCKDQLRRMFTSAGWLTNQWSKKTEGKKVEGIMLKTSFWSALSYSLKVMKPLVMVLRLVDGEKPAMGYIYEAMDRAKETIKNALDDKLQKYGPIWDIIDRRWDNQMHRPLHAAGHFLNPAYYYSNGNFDHDTEVKKGFYDCIDKLAPDRKTQDLIMQEIRAYRDSKGMFGRDIAIRQRTTCAPVDWWLDFGSDAPNLQKLATRILSLTCSSSPCERNWSTFEQINQMEKDKDVVPQSQAIGILEALPQHPFSVVNALNGLLNDSKAFWRVRIEAALALARTASEDTDWAGLVYLVRFYKSRRFDADIGLPRPNDFHDIPEYFVLKAIPQAIALVRAADKKSPREAVEFILLLLKYNDNSGNQYSDVYWLSSLVQSISELEFGQQVTIVPQLYGCTNVTLFTDWQNIMFLSSLLKRIDRLLLFDSLMPSHNGLLTISCIRTLTQIALKMSASMSLDRVANLIKSFRNDQKTQWKVRIEASRALLTLEFYWKGLDAALSLFMEFLEQETSLRGQAKLTLHAMHLCQVNVELENHNVIRCPTLLALLQLLASRKAHNNVYLRHHLFCMLQIIAGRPPTLHGVPCDQPQDLMERLNVKAGGEQLITPSFLKLRVSKAQVPFVVLENPQESMGEIKILQDPPGNTPRPREPPVEEEKPQEPHVDTQELQDQLAETKQTISGDLPISSAAKDADIVSTGHERKYPVVKIKIKQPSSSAKADGTDRLTGHSRGGRTEIELRPTSSVSVDAPARSLANEPTSTSNHNLEEVNSLHDRGSRMTASVGSAKLMSNDDVARELQCTADSNVSKFPKDCRLSPATNPDIWEAHDLKCSSQTHDVESHIGEPRTSIEPHKSTKNEKKEKKHKKEDERKRKRDDRTDGKGHHDDPEYLERKRLKKEKKRMEKELTKAQTAEVKPSSSNIQSLRKAVEPEERSPSVEFKKPESIDEPKGSKGESLQTALGTKFRIKLKRPNGGS